MIWFLVPAFPKRVRAPTFALSCGLCLHIPSKVSCSRLALSEVAKSRVANFRVMLELRECNQPTGWFGIVLARIKGVNATPM